jgi:hypothetical protein
MNKLIEIIFIIFLFYSNLLMGEYSHSGLGVSNGLLYALNDILTINNFIIALITSTVGCVIVEYLRNRLDN